MILGKLGPANIRHHIEDTYSGGNVGFRVALYII